MLRTILVIGSNVHIDCHCRRIENNNTGRPRYDLQVLPYHYPQGPAESARGN